MSENDDERYMKHHPVVTEILRRKAQSYATSNGHQYFSCEDYEMWLPTKDDIPSLIESIKFWRSLRPLGDAENWTDIQTHMYLQIKKKEMICYALLGKVPDMWDYVFKHMANGKNELSIRI